MFARVALPRPIDELFDYAVPDELCPGLVPGCRVEVPFGRRRKPEVGVCVALADTTEVPAGKIKSVSRVLDVRPIVSAAILELTRWMAQYYACSWGEALQASVPGGVKKGVKGRLRRVVKLACSALEAEDRIKTLQDSYPGRARVLRLLLEADAQLTRAEIGRRCKVSAAPLSTLERHGLIATEDVMMDADPLAGIDVPPHPPPAELTLAQQVVLDRVRDQLASRAFGVTMLHGVTGSGKTEIYLRAIQKVLADGGAAIVLIPEISLTPQTVARFRARFDDVAILHSGLTGAQRHDQWVALRDGHARVAIGPRSAVFAPVEALRLIVVDEEHEPSYKQQSTPRYHARDVAVMRAKAEGAMVLLGSATPALESYSNASSGKYSLVELPERVSSRAMPKVHIIDMTTELTDHGVPVLFSRPLTLGVQRAIEDGKQVILFLNRRGFSTYLHCQRCKHVHKCVRCDVSMTYHKRMDRVVCHYCLAEDRPPRRCPACDNPSFRYTGVGTQKIEEVLAQTFPGVRYARMDSDTMTTPAHYERVLRAFGAGELSILFGTQMIAKGLDFPGVTVVGVLSADIGMHFPDFRAAERTFQLIAQVAGRAGRGDAPGRVYVQTRFAEHYAILAAAQHDYAGFYSRELNSRRELGYPPFARLVRLLFEDEREERARRSASKVKQALLPYCGVGREILGPVPAPIAYLRDRHRYQLLLRVRTAGELLRLRPILGQCAAIAGQTNLTIDVDPTSLL